MIQRVLAQIALARDDREGARRLLLLSRAILSERGATTELALTESALQDLENASSAATASRLLPRGTSAG